jgi:hypothetical protein
MHGTPKVEKRFLEIFGCDTCSNGLDWNIGGTAASLFLFSWLKHVDILE